MVVPRGEKGEIVVRNFVYHKKGRWRKIKTAVPGCPLKRGEESKGIRNMEKRVSRGGKKTGEEQMWISGRQEGQGIYCHLCKIQKGKRSEFRWLVKRKGGR